MAIYTNAQTVLWLILSELESYDKSTLTVPLFLEFLFSPNPEYRQVACDLAVDIGGFDGARMEDHQLYGSEHLKSFAEKAPAAGLQLLKQWLDSTKDEEEKKKIFEAIGDYAAVEINERQSWTDFRRKSCADLLLQNMNSELTHADNRELVVALAKCDYPLDVDVILKSKNWPTRLKYMPALLGLKGRAEHWPVFIKSWFECGSRGEEEAEKYWAQYIIRAEPPRSVLDQIVAKLEHTEWWARRSFEKIPILMVLALTDYEYYEKTIERFMKSDELMLRKMALWAVAENWRSDPVPYLERCLKERYLSVTGEACRSLLKIDNYKTCKLALQQLKSRSWKVREWAANALAKWYYPPLLDSLLPLVKDGDEDVRIAALEAVKIYKDRRVLAEILAAMVDTDEGVRGCAKLIILQGGKKHPSLVLHPDYSADTKWVDPTLKKLAEIIAWGQNVGAALLGKPVRVKTFRQGLGRTPNSNENKEIYIEASAMPFLSGHKHGADIFRAIILHEIGHHLYDIDEPGQKTMEGIARSEGLQHVFAILIDERLERKMRSYRPEWGRYFDRLTAYAFVQEETLVPASLLGQLMGRDEDEVVIDIQAGKLPGRLKKMVSLNSSRQVALLTHEKLAIPGLMVPLMVFLICLRCRFDFQKIPVPEVIQAIEAVPANLKSLDHAGVLEVAKAIGALLGRDKDHKRHIHQLRQKLEQLKGRMPELLQALDQIQQLGLSPGAGQAVRIGPYSHHLPSFDLENDSDEEKDSFQHRGNRLIPRSSNSDTQFTNLKKDAFLEFNEQAHKELVLPLRRHIRLLQPYLEKLGKDTVMEGGHRKGRRLDTAILSRALIRKSSNMLRREFTVVNANCYIGIVIDCSGSMEGEELHRACAFAALLAESAKGLRGLTGHVNAFDDETFFHLGNFERNTIASLEAGGGNNDSGALKRAAELALASGKPNRLLIMISDGHPTECSFESLQYLVDHLTNHLGIVCAQVAVDSLPKVAFPNYLDLSEYEFHEAVSRFGRMLINLTSHWR